ncbi:alpha/beta hydrolase, partial [Candidatus Hydrogenedentota bacterium]
LFAPMIAPRPMLMVCSSNDKAVPPPMAKALFDAAGEPKKIVWKEAGHNKMENSAEIEVTAFLDRVFPEGHFQTSIEESADEN